MRKSLKLLLIINISIPLFCLLIFFGCGNTKNSDSTGSSTGIANIDSRVELGNLPKEIFENVNDYGFMWWEDGVRNTSNHVFRIRTNHYALSFDFPKLAN